VSVDRSRRTGPKPLRDYCLGADDALRTQEALSRWGGAGNGTGADGGANIRSLLHFVGEGRWSDEKVSGEGAGEMVLPAIERHGPIEAWIIDDTGFPKKGTHSVGRVARQYCGQLGKQDNCQVAVSLSLANRHASLPVAYRCICRRHGPLTPPAVRRPVCLRGGSRFRTKPEIALEQIRAACRGRALPRGVVLMDAGYGHPPRPTWSTTFK